MTLTDVQAIIMKPASYEDVQTAFSEYKRGELSPSLYEQALALTGEVANALSVPSKPEEMLRRDLRFECAPITCGESFKLYLSFFNNLDLTCCGYSVGWIPDRPEDYPWCEKLQKTVDNLDPTLSMGGLSFDEDNNRLNFCDLFILHTLTPQMFIASLALCLMETDIIIRSFAPFRAYKKE